MSIILKHIERETSGMSNRGVHSDRLIAMVLAEIEQQNPDLISDALSTIDSDIEERNEADERLNERNRNRLARAAGMTS